ncbi:hypothetical protein KC19_6G064000 [Ceratodon purpureus]|uniref:Uncharacterized protein n=1 Tax=Ceratodon purpureus TaxID=3225 RepID=A0A8T0HF30_CERPU|nr:hypothetical protein KC19_6G064000 [Ceratodon purpureus]
MTYLRNDSTKLNLNLCTTAGGVFATVLVILCALFTIATVDFSTSSSPQRSLDWLLSSEPGQNTNVAWYSGEHLPPPTQIVENGSTGVESQLATAPTEVTEIVHPAPSPVAEESVPSIRDGDHVEIEETVESAPNPSVAFEASVGDLGDGGTVDSAPSPDEELGDEEFSEPSELDSVEETPAPESSVEESAEKWGQQSGEALTNWNYGVCLLVTMGRSWAKRGLPYSELYRLFNAAKGLKKRKVLVGTDADPTIFCKMVRDAMGPSARCVNFNRLGVTSNKCEHLVVGATQKYTPQPSPSELQEYGFQWNKMLSVDLDVEDPARKPPSLPESEWQPTIVTAFSSNHAEVGLLLLRSLARVAAQQREFNVSVVVWTMDHFPTIAVQALACVVEELKTVYNVPTEVRAFDFNAWPPWMRINQKKGYNGGRGEYAWKAVMIHTVLVERGFVYWADAGDRFKSVAGLTETLRNVKQNGFASRHSSGQVRTWTHPMQLEYFGANNDGVKKQLNCDASGIGFTLQSYNKLARPWYECSITRQCIAPDGSSRKNHRQDQSALTVLVILSGAECEGVNSGITKNMDSQPHSYRVGVDPTKCYKDPLSIKWHRRLM